MRVFISYRHGATDDAVTGIVDWIESLYGTGTCLVDRQIRPGTDWRNKIGDWIGRATIVLVIIGKDSMQKRKSSSENFWMFEISKALILQKRIIPVLVGEAQLPRKDQLPPETHPLLEKHALKLDDVHNSPNFEPLRAALGDEPLREGLGPDDARIEIRRNPIEGKLILRNSGRGGASYSSVIVIVDDDMEFDLRDESGALELLHFLAEVESIPGETVQVRQPDGETKNLVLMNNVLFPSGPYFMVFSTHGATKRLKPDGEEVLFGVPDGKWPADEDTGRKLRNWFDKTLNRVSVSLKYKDDTGRERFFSESDDS